MRSQVEQHSVRQQRKRFALQLNLFTGTRTISWGLRTCSVYPEYSSGFSSLYRLRRSGPRGSGDGRCQALPLSKCWLTILCRGMAALAGPDLKPDGPIRESRTNRGGAPGKLGLFCKFRFRYRGSWNLRNALVLFKAAKQSATTAVTKHVARRRHFPLTALLPLYGSHRRRG
jgi:hypothetical protein